MDLNYWRFYPPALIDDLDVFSARNIQVGAATGPLMPDLSWHTSEVFRLYDAIAEAVVDPNNVPLDDWTVNFHHWLLLHIRRGFVYGVDHMWKGERCDGNFLLLTSIEACWILVEGERNPAFVKAWIDARDGGEKEAKYMQLCREVLSTAEDCEGFLQRCHRLCFGYRFLAPLAVCPNGLDPAFLKESTVPDVKLNFHVHTLILAQLYKAYQRHFEPKAWEQRTSEVEALFASIRALG